MYYHFNSNHENKLSYFICHRFHYFCLIFFYVHQQGTFREDKRVHFRGLVGSSDDNIHGCSALVRRKKLPEKTASAGIVAPGTTEVGWSHPALCRVFPPSLYSRSCTYFSLPLSSPFNRGRYCDGDYSVSSIRDDDIVFLGEDV